MAAEQRAVAAIGGGKDVAAAVDVEDRLVDMHRTARLVRHRLCQEGGIDTVFERNLPHDTLEQQHLIGPGQRIAMDEIELELGGARNRKTLGGGKGGEVWLVHGGRR